MKKLSAITLTILSLSLFFTACSFKFGDSQTVGENGEYDLEINRTFQIGEKPDGDYQHGDYTVIRELENGGTVGSLVLLEPGEAIFILSDGEVFAGPLTTIEEVQ